MSHALIRYNYCYSALCSVHMIIQANQYWQHSVHSNMILFWCIVSDLNHSHHARHYNYCYATFVCIYRSEILVIFKCYIIYSVGLVLEASAISVIMFVMFSVYTSTSTVELVPRNVFVALSLINFLHFTTVRLLTLVALQVSNAHVAWKRIKVMYG